MKVYKSINAIQAALAKIGIKKDQKNTAQNFKFRGIDAVYAAMAPLLATHGLCILPKVTSREVTERPTARGGLLFYVSLMVDFHFVSSEDGSTHVVTICGEAMDPGDKATNKAMSAAYKYACLQAFCIPVEGDNDADATSHDFVTPLHALVNKIKSLKNPVEIGKSIAEHYSVKRVAELSETQMIEAIKKLEQEFPV